MLSTSMTDKAGKILIVDDSEAVLEAEKNLLQKTGLHISLAKNGPEAIKKTYLEKPDIIFLDLMLPEINGDQVCRFIKNDKDLKETAVIIVTAKTDPETMQRCFKCGCDAYLSKPVTAKELLSKLKVVLDDKDIYIDWDVFQNNAE